jgi:hypothetical protein
MTVVNRTKDAVECQWISIIQTSFKIVYYFKNVVTLKTVLIIFFCYTINICNSNIKLDWLTVEMKNISHMEPSIEGCVHGLG